MRATTAPYGNVEPPFPICDLAAAAGATYVARSTVYHALELDKYLAQAISNEGFSLVEAVSYCHTTFGRINRLGTAAEMMRALKGNSISKSAYDRLSEDERGSNPKIVRGVLHTKQRPEYTKVYDSLVDRIHGESIEMRNYGGN
jgi:2-oxoglutarate ferredoxin oxidoreductase subunit beta